MINKLIELIKNIDIFNLNVRDRRAHYASQNQTCIRDQYWSWMGEPPTNPVDFVGRTKMLIGDWIEKGFVKDILSRLHFFNYHLIGTQIPVGGTNPNWDGYLDALMEDRTMTPPQKFVVEIKTKSGIGAEMFLEHVDVSLDYIAQLGLYLSDVYKKLNILHGKLIYILLSDKTWGTIVIVNCKFNPDKNEIVIENAVTSKGDIKQLNKSYSIKPFLDRWIKLDEHIKTRTPPKGEYKYAYELTPEVLSRLSDDALRKIIHRQAIIGDWQVLYSRYKDKQIMTDGLSVERSDEDIALAKAEYRRRHPRSKI